MIVKAYELKKKNLTHCKYFLFYGSNKGLIDETINNTIKPLIPNNIYRYEENDIIMDPQKFEESLSSKSFFDDEKIIIISRASDKLYKILENIIEKDYDGIILVLTTNTLEKKSKIRNFFEKNRKSICVAFYEDNFQSLNFLAQKFLKEKKILLSQENINLIIERSTNDRINLYNELNKIEVYLKNKKKIDTKSILELTNLSENFSIFELVDYTLIKNKKKVFNILNENIFIAEDIILILRTFLNKLKRLFKIKSQLKNNSDLDKIITIYKPPIFWKEKDIVKKQIKIWNLNKIQDLIIEVNDIELQVKKNPNLSINLLTNFILEQAQETNN
tara:strand:- start:2467 stop:3462 length:996 start_codon:yes stop_codon:yes gene_type:complete